MFRSGFVALIGRPNVGKSTLMNHLIGQKIAITSEKPQTTRGRIRTVYTDERGQIVFLDTPGMHRARSKLGSYMMSVADGTLKEADVILWLVEPSAHIGAGDQEILEKLHQVSAPVVVVINKCDTVLPAVLEKAEAAFHEVLPSAEVLSVSALRDIRTELLLETLFGLLKEGPAFYDEDTVTDQSMRDISAEIIREKALRNLTDEIPHGIAVVLEQMKEQEDGSFEIEASIVCERESHKGIVIGKGGQMLKRIGSQARHDIEKMTGTHVFLRLFVKVRKDWRNSDQMLKNFGYKDEG